MLYQLSYLGVAWGRSALTRRLCIVFPDLAVQYPPIATSPLLWTIPPAAGRPAQAAIGASILTRQRI